MPLAEAGSMGLSRQRRLTGRSAYAGVLKSGRRLQTAGVSLVFLSSAHGVSRLGVTVGRRVAGKATDRNHLKRLAREVFRCHPVRGAGLDVVIVARGSCEPVAPERWRKAIRDLLDKACGSVVA